MRNSFENLLPKIVLPCVVVVILSSIAYAQSDPLSSWNDTAPKKAIVEFVEKVIDPGSPDYVPPSARIATFDNDGTLWSEQPVYFQALFIVDRIRQLAPQHPEWKNQEPFASVLKGDFKGALEDLNRSISHYPEDAMLYKNRGNLYLLFNQPRQAIEDYTKAIQMEDKLAEAYYNRGMAYLLLQDQGKGCQDLIESAALGYEQAAYKLSHFCTE